jgi:uncharacterized protein YcgL (UPF0745 family)
MRCYVYKSARRADTYVYLAASEDFAALPDALRQQLGHLTLALEFELTADKRLAQADAAHVLAQISAAGYYLQVPPPVVRLD